MPNFEVLIKAAAVVAVLDVESREEAQRIATEEWGREWDEMETREITDERDLDSTVRHADYVSKP